MSDMIRLIYFYLVKTKYQPQISEATVQDKEKDYLSNFASNNEFKSDFNTSPTSISSGIYPFSCLSMSISPLAMEA